ncbi:MAG: hypothetical protein IJX99_00535 [Clostridia bacterium]|nr:hypothetical protein [Clostridia bacterium]
MKNLIDDVRRHTPKIMPGYNYVKTQNVYIPLKKVTIECLTRKISELNLFFESILKLIEISVKKTSEIAEILGVSIGVVNEAIVDMVNIDYVFVSEGVLTITEKGAKALETRQKIDIQKTYLQEILVDMITGTVCDADLVKLSRTGSRSVILESVIDIDDSYLDTHFQEINCVYQLQQKKNSVFGNSAITNELYKIIGVSYSELHYLENKVYIYKSDSSDELLFVFSNDSNDKFKNEFYNQLKDSFRPCQEYFFEKNRDLINEAKRNVTEIDEKKLLQTQVVTQLLFSEQNTDDDLFSAFVQDRYALNDKEYLSYLYNPKAFRYSKIYICSNHLGKLLSNVFCYQINILSENIPIYIVYNKNEYGIDKSLGHYFKDHKSNLYLIPKESIDDNVICFDSELLIYFREHIVTAFERPVAYSQMECCFSKQVVKDVVRKIVDKYDINIFIEGMRILDKPDKPRIKKK